MHIVSTFFPPTLTFPLPPHGAVVFSKPKIIQLYVTKQYFFLKKVCIFSQVPRNILGNWTLNTLTSPNIFCHQE